MFLHAITLSNSLWERMLLAIAVTSVWLFREMFPVNSFSNNYTKIDPKSSDIIRLLYRIKKYQYVFYKHFLLHGLNISVAMTGRSLASDASFRIYWLLLNTSYVMEFFLQTLVKKRYMKQDLLLLLQRILMVASSIAAINVLSHVNLLVCFCSLFLNFVNRHHDFFNSCLLIAVAFF